jgi:hypothetical protein
MGKPADEPIILPGYLVAAIDAYLDTDWSDGRPFVLRLRRPPDEDCSGQARRLRQHDDCASTVVGGCINLKRLKAGD